jgi:hypothetical protein
VFVPISYKVNACSPITVSQYRCAFAREKYLSLTPDYRYAFAYRPYRYAFAYRSYRYAFAYRPAYRAYAYGGYGPRI